MTWQNKHAMAKFLNSWWYRFVNSQLAVITVSTCLSQFNLVQAYLFKSRLVNFWMSQNVNYDYTVNLAGTGDGSEYDIETFWKVVVVFQEWYGHRGSSQPASVNVIDFIRLTQHKTESVGASKRECIMAGSRLHCMPHYICVEASYVAV